MKCNRFIIYNIDRTITSIMSASGTPTTPELDTEWIKFMSRLSRQQNCDNADSDNSDSEPNVEKCGMSSSVFSTAPTAAATAAASAAATASANGNKVKKSCISKKSQRRTYSFIDAAVNDDENIDCSATRTEPTTTTTTTIPMSRSVRSKITPIYISTKTKIAYLNCPVNIYDMFWKIPVQHYYERREGVIKKQIKFQTTDPAVVASIKEKLEQQPRIYDEFVIEHIDNPTGRIPYKDQRKVSIGLCKKDLHGGISKKKRAFFNCFVVILRIVGGVAPPDERAPEDDVLYKEMHVKVFNTGKLEIPGIQEDSTLVRVLQLLVTVLRPFLGDELDYIRNRCETALINSNFNCGFYIDRDKLFNLLKFKYRMNCNYDSCSYPGIQSKFYYIPDKMPDEQNGQQPVSTDMPYYEVSFMIFRTGSILIVGKCNEEILNVIYRFICTILETDYTFIQMGDIPADELAGSGAGGAKGGKNTRKKKISITNIQFYE
jgi:hypothetical protein